MSTSKDLGGENRRRAERTPLIEQFYLAAVLPERGPYRLTVADVSELGVGFRCEGSEIESWYFQLGDTFPLHLFLNQRLFLPLKVRVAQLHPDGKAIHVGAEILKEESEGYEALLAFLKMLDAIPPSARQQLSILR